MKALLVAIAVCAAGTSFAHAADQCTDAQWHEALGSAPARDGSKLVAKTVLDDPMNFTVQVYDAQKEGYPLVCERRYSLPRVSQVSAPAAHQVTASR